MGVLVFSLLSVLILYALLLLMRGKTYCAAKIEIKLEIIFRAGYTKQDYFYLCASWPKDMQRQTHCAER